MLPNPAVYAPMGGEYTVQNIMNDAASNEIGAWWRIADHTQGNETGRMMVVNSFNPGAVFFRSQVDVQPETNYLFTAWILNLFKATGYPDPELGVRVLDENGGILYSATLGQLIPVHTDVPEWKQIGSVIQSGPNTRLTVEFLSEGPEVVGNDYAIDDIALREIQVPQFIPIKTVDRPTANVGETVRFTVTLSIERGGDVLCLYAGGGWNPSGIFRFVQPGAGACRRRCRYRYRQNRRLRHG